jgi:hypothetical protein
MTTRHLHLVPVDGADHLQRSRAEHPSSQAPLDETVFEWHGLVAHELSETACCHQRIEVTNLVADESAIARDVVAMLSTVLHGWDGYDVMVLVTITPPTPTVP